MMSNALLKLYRVGNVGISAGSFVHHLLLISTEHLALRRISDSWPIDCRSKASLFRGATTTPLRTFMDRCCPRLMDLDHESSFGVHESPLDVRELLRDFAIAHAKEIDTAHVARRAARIDPVVAPARHAAIPARHDLFPGKSRLRR